MKRQILKGLSILSVMLTLAFSTAIANGQSTKRLTAQIPFDFVIGDRSLPAGNYTVAPHGQDDACLRVRNSQTNDSAIRLSNSIEPGSSSGKARLVFHRYGQKYFLAEVWRGGNETGRVLLRSKQEKAMQREMKTSAQVKYDNVELVAALQ